MKVKFKTYSNIESFIFSEAKARFKNKQKEQEIISQQIIFQTKTKTINITNLNF